MKRLTVLALALAVGCASIPSKPQSNPLLDEDGELKVEYFIEEMEDGSRVFFNKFIANHLVYLYDGISRELPMCLLGEEKPQGLYVDDIKMPLMSMSTPHSAGYTPVNCVVTGRYIGMVHNHPYGSCGMSQVDFNRFVRDDAVLEMIICDANMVTGNIEFAMYKKTEIRGEMYGVQR